MMILNLLKENFFIQMNLIPFFSKETKSCCKNHLVQQLIVADLNLSHTGSDKTTLSLNHDLSHLLFAKFSLEHNAFHAYKQEINIYLFENRIQQNPFIIADCLGIFEVKFKNGMDIWL